MLPYSLITIHIIRTKHIVNMVTIAGWEKKNHLLVSKEILLFQTNTLSKSYRVNVQIKHKQKNKKMKIFTMSIKWNISKDHKILPIK